MMQKLRDEKGFTLIEMMVAIAISSIVMLVIHVAYQNQLRSHLTQQSVADMHQNARAAMSLMKNEIQMAGFDPTQKANASILTANASDFRFEIDLNEDGDCGDGNEVVHYVLNGDDLERATGAGVPVLLAENIDALDFVYFDGNMNPIDLSTPPLSANELASIRLVQITIVARAEDPALSYKHTDTNTYTNNAGTAILLPADYAANSTARRARLSLSVWCRNMGKV